ncbi:MAG: alpha/beta hydrolase [Polyangiaceae bacterium]|nr:alpha/beta hydrolase [Polyangiaceae bacterium]
MSLEQAKQVFISGPDRSRLACRILGAHNPNTVILTSGIGCGPVFMHEIARDLARDHRVVYWDFRSHGDSDLAPIGSGYEIHEHAGDLDKVVRAFARGEKPVMVGFSMGVQVTVEWTRNNPDRADAFVFLLGLPRNPVHRTVLLRRPAARLADGIATHAGPALRFVQPATRALLRTSITYALAKRLGVIHPACPRDEFLDFVRYATNIPHDAYLQCAAGLMRHDATDAFLRIHQPVYMVAADGDVFISAEECRSFAEQLPQAKFELLTYASHAGSIEYGRYFAGRIRKFLAGLKTGRESRAA